MKKALILGIGGTFGGHIAREMLALGYALSALVRQPDKVRADFPKVAFIQGDVADKHTLRKAAEGMDIMVYGVNPPNYHWENRAIPWLDQAASVAEELGMSLLFPGNVYLYDPAHGPDFTEQSPVHPVGKMGRIRQAMEARLASAAENGAQVIIIRAGDFIAANTATSWLNLLLSKTRRGYKLTLPGPTHIKHSWAYVPDLAKVAVALIEQRNKLPTFHVTHFEGFQISFADMVSAIEQESGQKVSLGKFPWWLIHLCSPFSVMFRGLIEMRYLWEKEVNLKSHQAGLPEQLIQQTPLKLALQKADLL